MKSQNKLSINAAALLCRAHLLLLSVLAGLCWACESFVEVSLPSSQLNAEAVFEDRASAEAAVADIYASLRESGMLVGNLSGITNTLGSYSDELTFYGSSSDVTQQFFNNNVDPANATILTWWNKAYNQVYAANAVIEGVTASTALTAAEKELFKGEALFLRALIHFYLSSAFGDIPYVVTTDYQANSTVGRIPASQVLAMAAADLSEAAALLEEPGPGVRSRANKGVAMALLARVFLYNGQLAEAADSASFIINNSSVYSLEQIEDVFLKQSSETIWHLVPRTEGNNTYEGAAFIFPSGPPSQVSLSNNLMGAFETGDLRKEHWTKAVTDGTDTWYHAFKYRERTPTGVSLEYPVVLRLVEQYLIRAEARAVQGELLAAKQDLDMVRNRAGLGNSTANTQEELLAAIEQERRVELFTEYGHRFFDLKRTSRLDAVLAPQKSGWQPTDRNLPLPDNELRLNPNLLPQNQGY